MMLKNRVESDSESDFVVFFECFYAKTDLKISYNKAVLMDL